ncbi:MAG: TetR family transcriptional regulator [Chloroflexi bacterium]|nr:TetR family transcriptional regulator [Chloroflexota bacterium]MDA1146682.1 TetR family transcriptional regulator [Chloroflexota bacterium]
MTNIDAAPVIAQASELAISRYGRYRRPLDAEPASAEDPTASGRSLQAEATRQSLMRAARALFGAAGYEATALGDIVKRAGVTRGALYYHYEGKCAVFEAVYRAVQAELRDRAIEAYGRDRLTTPASARVRAGLDEYLEQSAQPEVQQIIFGDGVAVLGWEHCRAIEREYSLGALLTGLDLIRNEGTIAAPADLEVSAYILAAALSEASYLIAHADDREEKRAAVAAVIENMLDGLLSLSRMPA